MTAATPAPPSAHGGRTSGYPRAGGKRVRGRPFKPCGYAPGSSESAGGVGRGGGWCLCPGVPPWLLDSLVWGARKSSVACAVKNGSRRLCPLRAAAAHMVERAKNGDPGGSLVGVASLAATEGAARNQHYAATKGAVISMMKSIAVEFARYGVRANSILPGWIETDMTAGAQDNERFQNMVMSRVPAKRWGHPDDFGGVAVYLTSNASAYHSGDLFVIDGAYSIF